MLSAYFSRYLWNDILICCIILSYQTLTMPVLSP